MFINYIHVVLQDLFISVDRQNTGKISNDALREILCTTTSHDLKTDVDKYKAICVAAALVRKLFDFH